MGGMCNLLSRDKPPNPGSKSSVIPASSGSLGISWGGLHTMKNSPRTICLSKFMKPSVPYFHRTCQVWVGSLPSSTRPFHGPESSRKGREIIGPGLLLWSGQAANSFWGVILITVFFPGTHPSFIWDSLFGFALMNCPGVSLRVRFPSGIGQLHFEWFTDDMQQFHRFRCQISWHRVCKLAQEFKAVSNKVVIW